MVPPATVLHPYDGNRVLDNFCEVFLTFGPPSFSHYLKDNVIPYLFKISVGFSFGNACNMVQARFQVNSALSRLLLKEGSPFFQVWLAELKCCEPIMDGISKSLGCVHGQDYYRLCICIYSIQFRFNLCEHRAILF